MNWHEHYGTIWGPDSITGDVEWKDKDRRTCLGWEKFHDSSWYHIGWWSETEKRWNYGALMSPHITACLIEHHLRVWLTARDVAVNTYVSEPGAMYHIVRMHGNGFLARGYWTDNTTDAASFTDYAEAQVAAAKAVAKEINP